MRGLARKIAWSMGLCLMAWLAGLLWFVSLIPTQPNASDTVADAIVTLTGGGGRIERGLTLLAEGKGRKLFITGVGGPLSVDGLLRQAPPSLRETLAARRSAIFLGREAENTIGNAQETRGWLAEHGCRSLRLVTSSYHMPRSLAEFGEIEGVTLIPDPVFPEDFTLGGWWLHTESRQLVLSEYHKLAASKLRHWIVRGP